VPTDLICRHSSIRVVIDERRIRKLSNWFLNQCGVADHSLSLLLVDDLEICRLNNQYRQKNKPTNVLSFPLAEGADQPLLHLPFKELGDIVISVETAYRESIEHNQKFYDRLTWLIVHGLLHLLGYDHEKSERHAKKMYDKETELIDKLHFQRRIGMTQLAINVDHVATVREARGGNEPDPIYAAAICEAAGASGIVVHLREDRRHMQDRDIHLLRQTVKTKLNLEMGANKEIIKFALDLQPDLITLVPENRQELTTEGGLDVLSQKKKIAKVIDKMSKKDIPVSIFCDPDSLQIQASKEIGATFVELHTGRYSEAADENELEHEFRFLVDSAEEAYQLGLRVCAGHGLDYRNTAPIAALETIEELSIGHAIISRAIFTGLDQAVREMAKIVNQASLSF